MNVTPDATVYWEAAAVKLNATLVFTWLVMTLMVLGSWLVTRRLTTGTNLPRTQNVLEVVVTGIREQIREVTEQDPDRYLPFIGTLFLFIAVSNVLAIVPGFQPPTGSLSTTAALALCVLVAVPVYGVAEHGLVGYLKNYIRPSVFMMPFNVIGELSRTLALAIRLFGNVMSGTMIAAMLLAVAPFVFPVLMHAMGLLTGLIQAYIFAVLALVYIAAATRGEQEQEQVEVQGLKGEASNG